VQALGRLLRKGGREMKRFLSCAVVAVLVLVFSQMSWAGATLDAVKSRGYVQAGVNGALFGFPEIISKEPLAPAVRHGDEQWFDIVNFSVLALIEAEELGITSRNVDEMLKSTDPRIQRFLGVTPGNGKALGVDEKFAYTIVKQIGNYGEVFERNVGAQTPLKLDRGLNGLWTKGGLMYSPPFK